YSTVHYEKCIPSFCEIIRDILISAVLIALMLVFSIVSYYYLHFSEYYKGVNAEVREKTAPFMAMLFILLAVVTLFFAVKYFIKCARNTVRNVREIINRVRHNMKESVRTKGFSRFQRQNKMRWDEKKKFLAQELSKIKALLDEAYDFDIIPKQHRFLESIYYTYEFVFSLTEENTGDLFTKQVEESIKKYSVVFDDIMSQHYQDILGDKIMESKSKGIYSKNLMLLQNLEKNEKNTNKSEQYAKIAESYIKISKYFSLAKYLEV
ncbi:MAG: hypothetical protein K2M82_04370, partial [Lachnospiraceae bacterium]|nr:hypothetical protein [Lachnospiraceae bacterium]